MFDGVGYTCIPNVNNLRFLGSLPYGSEAHFLLTSTRGRSRLPARSVLLSLRLRGLHRRPAPSFPGLPLSKNSPPDCFLIHPLRRDEKRSFALCGARPEALGLACRLGRRFCCAEVSTGHPRPLDSAAFVKAGETLYIFLS